MPADTESVNVALPSTKPLDGEFWYVLDDIANIVWRPRPKLRGDFYLGWLGQTKNVVGAGLVRIKQGQLTHICTHGSLYYWLQPYEVLSTTSATLCAQQVLGSDTMTLDFFLAGWGLRNQTSPKPRQWSDAPVSAAVLEPLLGQATLTIVRNYRSEGEPPSKPEYRGLLARAGAVHPPDPHVELLDLLKATIGEPNVVPVLIELVKHDLNVMPRYRESDFYETLATEEQLPPLSKVARLVISAIYHLAPLVGSRRLSSILLLNSLRQRHPFDVAWGADFLVKCFGMPILIRMLLVALVKEKNDQIRGNVLDLLQELGYGVRVSLENEVLKDLRSLLNREDPGAFDQVINSHLTFVQEYMRQRDAALHLTS